MSRLSTLHELSLWDTVAFAVGYMKKYDPYFKKNLYHYAICWSNGGAICLD